MPCRTLRNCRLMLRPWVLGLLLAGAALQAPVEAVAMPTGAIVITDHLLNPAKHDFEKDLKTEAKTALPKPPESESWKVFFIASLTRAPGAEDVNIVFYDASVPVKAGQPKEPVQAYPLRTKATARMLQASIDLKDEDGFKAGKKYTVLITRLVGGKEEVYARSALELK